MKKTLLDRIIDNLREEMMVSGSNPQGFSSAAIPKGPVAGFDPAMEKGKVLKRKKRLGIWSRSLRKNGAS